jgi:hypothetical protein
VNTIIGRTVTGEYLQIDETRFVGCTLDRCVLGYNGGEISFDSTILRNCSYIFCGQAERTVKLLQEIGLMPYIEQEWATVPVSQPFTPPDGH